MREERAVNDPAARTTYCRTLTARLPDWFGISDANDRSASGIAGRGVFGVFDTEGACVGQIALRPPFNDALGGACVRHLTKVRGRPLARPGCADSGCGGRTCGQRCQCIRAIESLQLALSVECCVLHRRQLCAASYRCGVGNRRPPPNRDLQIPVARDDRNAAMRFSRTARSGVLQRAMRCNVSGMDQAALQSVRLR